jgi:uncharacterized membrane protein
MKRLIHYGDSLAIPGFLLLSQYFYLKENKSILEYVLLAFSVACLIIDIIFTSMYAPDLLVYAAAITLGVQAYSISNGWLSLSAAPTLVRGTSAE